MDLGIRGRVAFVGGSSSGLGLAVARELAAEGANVVLVARRGDVITREAEAIAALHSVRVLPVMADLSDAASARDAVARVLDEFGGVDILVNNTGGPPAGAFEVHDDEAWLRAYHLLLRSALILTRAFLPGMKERRWGRVINITSIAVKQPVDTLILSNSMRAAVTGFARTLANEVGSFGITVNNVMPGYTRTDRLASLAAGIAERGGHDVADAYAKWEREIPMGRVGEPPEFAALVAFLASDRASYITGTSVPVDGGWIRSLL
ncbi:MAG: SDR family oxidoreductase [Longimicrobiales bacterium]